MRKTALMALATATTLALTGCGGGDSGTGASSGTSGAEAGSGTTAGSGAAADDTSQSSDAAAPAGGGDGTSLTIWTDANRKPALEAAAADFEAETGSTITLVEKNFEDIRADFMAQVPTGKGPDITIGAHDWLGAFIVNGVVNSVDLAGAESDFDQVAVDAFTYDGQLYGLPYAVESVALIRNTELAPNPAPETFDEMIAEGEQAGAKYPLLIKTGPEGDPYTYYAFQTSFGAPVFEQADDGSYTTELGLTGEGGHEYAQWLADNGPGGTGVFDTDITLDIAQSEFAEGNAPYTVDGPWNISRFEDAGLEVAVDPIPSPGGETAAPFVGVQGFYVSAQSQNALLANDFLTNYMATPEAMKAMFDADPRLPAMTEVADEVSSDPIMEGFRAAAANGVPMPSIPEMGDVWAFWGVTEAQIISGDVEPTEGWDKMVSDIQAAIE